MKKLLLVLLLVPLVSFGQTQILNGISVTPAKGYYYKPKLSNRNQSSFINSNGNELKVVVAKLKDRKITNKVIQSIIVRGNGIIKWRLESNGVGASISSGPNGIFGYRDGFECNGKLVAITTFATSQEEAIKTLQETLNNIKNNCIRTIAYKNLTVMDKCGRGEKGLFSIEEIIKRFSLNIDDLKSSDGSLAFSEGDGYSSKEKDGSKAQTYFYAQKLSSLLNKSQKDLSQLIDFLEKNYNECILFWDENEYHSAWILRNNPTLWNFINKM